MTSKLFLTFLVTLMLSMTGSRSLAGPDTFPSLAPAFKKDVPKVLILASYHDGDAWTSKLVHNLRYYFESVNDSVVVRVHYLNARELIPAEYLDDFGLPDNVQHLKQYDRVVVLDDTALALYLKQTPWLLDQQAIAVGINNAELMARAHAQGISLALTSEAIAESAALARQVTQHKTLLLLHSATVAGIQLKEQALQLVKNAGFDSVKARTWLSVYEDGIENTDQAVLALDTPLVLARYNSASMLSRHFQEKLGTFFCYIETLRVYGCDGGAFANIASLTHLVVQRLTRSNDIPSLTEAPLELSLSYALLDQLPKDIDVKVLDAPESLRLPGWALLLILLLALLLILGAGIAWWRLRTKQQLLNLITQEAEYDPLTQLYNQRKMLSLLGKLTDRGEEFCLLYLEVEEIKEINDTFGHAHGDRLLQGFAWLLRSIVRSHAAYGRMGEVKFLVLCRQKKQAARLAQRLTKALENPFAIKGQHYTLHCSIGIVQFPLHAQSVTHLLNYADVAMSAAKARAEAPIAVFTPQMLSDQARHTTLSHELERAIDDGGNQLELYIQPIHSLKQNAIIGGEVLLRWKHPSEGYISPGVFIPIAETSDLILKVSDWVVKHTFQRIAADQLHQSIGYLAINISAKQLYARRFARDASALALRCDVPTRAVSFEMTEHVRLMDMASIQQQIIELREAGFGVALDDFGAGYTSISFLQNINFSCVKIDRSLTTGLCGVKADTSRPLMRGLLYLGEQLSQKVVVEGVETHAESELLKTMGADHVQGYHYHRPMPWEAFARLVDTRSPVT